eukprot:CAMPEP_0198299200 /NCGR_PEP_ID=MMETSP1449-20131203/43844_1 /TAXON_ID=420275 /ORGANISM="Attheya septentrionalis, Strain CCMP2084" /LENGTH=55 /DNA_ID=CAMNT_0044000687 /DNA_START=11 /DNA_END=175 /DNA_ORIENTATION=-
MVENPNDRSAQKLVTRKIMRRQLLLFVLNPSVLMVILCLLMVLKFSLSLIMSLKV